MVADKLLFDALRFSVSWEAADSIMANDYMFWLMEMGQLSF